MNNFNYNMLRLARFARKMTQSALAKELGVKASFISQIEAGVTSMPEKSIQKIVEILDFPLSFFQQETTFLEGCSKMYRAQKSLKNIDRDYIDTYASFYNKHITKLLNADIFDLDNFEILDIRSNKYKTPEEIAEMVRSYWNIPRGVLSDLTRILEDKGIFVIPISIVNEEFDATFYVNEKNDFAIILINSAVPPDRYRFNLAHELGHLIMHRMPNPNCEDEAHAFASAFLMPKKDIAEDLSGICFWDLLSLKTKWKVSMQAITRRAKDLRKITKEQYESFYKQINYNGYRKKEPPCGLYKEKPQMLKYLVNYYLNELCYSKEQLCAFLDINKRDYNKMYGILLGNYIQDNDNSIRPHLSIVKN